MWTTIGSSVEVKASRRLGKAGGRRRPILVTVASREDHGGASEILVRGWPDVQTDLHKEGYASSRERGVEAVKGSGEVGERKTR